MLRSLYLDYHGAPVTEALSPKESGMKADLDTLASLAKRRGFAFPSAEIYGGFASTYDYGPLGVEMKRNIRDLWWRRMVQGRDDVVGIEAAVITNPAVWQASGHVGGFTDPLMDCLECQSRVRADHVENNTCPVCKAVGRFTEERQFNLLFRTFVGPVQEDASTAYLRPETAQGMFVNFENVQTTTRKRLPFGIAQIGRSYRNEITPGQFIFRTREFEQMGKELAHYSKATSDVEFMYPWGWGELEGIAHRGDFDLRAHSVGSGHTLSYFDPDTNEHVVPHVIEPAAGVDRIMFALLCDAYDEETDDRGEQRVVLRLAPSIAPVSVAILPLSRNERLVPTAREVWERLRPDFRTQYDDAQSIGRRYRRQDEVGTPLCVTVDFDTLDDQAVTIRERDSMAQVRVPLVGLTQALRDRLEALAPK